jgi:hypothetical protein
VGRGELQREMRCKGEGNVKIKNTESNPHSSYATIKRTIIKPETKFNLKAPCFELP